MKSRTSSCKATILKKDVTRFAPVWALYTVFLLMSLVMLRSNETDFWFRQNVGDSMNVMAVVNLIYAPVCAQLLFGDLYNTRMCNALHALPVSRESWFTTHLTAGMLFSFVPNALMALMGLFMLGNHWYLALVWLLVATAQFLCFYGIAIFSAMCAGNRFAQLVIYCIINFFAGIVMWMIQSLYEPMLFGIVLDYSWLQWFLPVMGLAQIGYVDVTRTREYDEAGENILSETIHVTMGDEWWYLITCCLLGVALIIFALLLYRRRKLEVAGDFLALPKLEPAFLVLFTLCAGNACQIFCDLFGYTSIEFLFLAIGLVVGWFAGLMLLKRTVRVFRVKEVLKCAALCAVVAASVVLTWLDPLGFTRWVPEAEDVASVTIYQSSYASEYSPHLTLTDTEDIETILGIHQRAIEAHKEVSEIRYETAEIVCTTPVAVGVGTQTEETETSAFVGCDTYIYLEYTMKNGSTKARYYLVFTADDDGRTLQSYFSTPESIFGCSEDEIGQFLSQISYATANDVFFFDEDLEGLMEAILADCETGSMIQSWDYHYTQNTMYWIDFVYKTFGEDGSTYLDLRVFENCENTIAWLEAHGVLNDQEYYG